MAINPERIKKLKLTSKPKDFLIKVLSLDGQVLKDFILNDQNWIDAFGDDWKYERWNIPWSENIPMEKTREILKYHFQKLLDNLN